MLRSTRLLGMTVLLAVSASLLGLGAAARAESLATGRVIGKVAVAPLAGDDFTPFSGGLMAAQCPAGTVDTYFDVYGQDVGVGAPRGSGDLGYLGVGSKDGRGPQRFTGASIANLRTAFAGSFSKSGTYRIRFGCGNAKGQPFAAYESVMTYTSGGNGSFRIAAPLFAPKQAPAPVGAPSGPGGPPSAIPGAGASGVPSAGPGQAFGDTEEQAGDGPASSVAADGDGGGAGLMAGLLLAAALALGGLAFVGTRGRRRAATG